MLQGVGTTFPDYNIAAQYYYKAMELGHAKAMVHLGYFAHIL